MSSTRPRTRRLRTLAGLGLSVALLGGCGSMDPGVAITVGDDQITTAEVDALAEDICSLAKVAPPQDPNAPAVQSGATVRGAAYQALALRSMADQMAEDNGVAVSDDFRAQQRQARLQYGGVDDQQLVEDALPGTTAIAYFVDVIRQVGAAEIGGKPSDEEAVAAGIQAAQEWQEANGIETSPGFPSFRIGDDRVITERSDLSVAVSDEAKAAIEGTESYVTGLPPTQRCGQ